MCANLIQGIAQRLGERDTSFAEFFYFRRLRTSGPPPG